MSNIPHENNENVEKNTVKLSKLIFDVSNLKTEEKISEKSCNTIYKVKIPQDNNRPEMTCAINYVNFDSTIEQERFFNEIEIQASLKHISILPLIGFSPPTKTINKYTIITPFMPNSTLSDLLDNVSKGNTIDNWHTIRSINIFGIAAGMTYIHQSNIIHRDLKPSNIYLDDKYYPKIADFYMSEKVEKEGLVHGQNGTPIYMAPEILNDVNSGFSNKIDVFSYSMILYQLLTLRVPYSDQSIGSYLFKLLNRETRPRIHSNEIPDIYANLITRCWDEDPEKRPSFIQIIKEFLEFKDEYFDLDLIDNEEFEDYIVDAIKDLDFD